ncbi:hypothetical protein PPYR_14528 [Photinus pyralis]|uniref:Uncharacterized protein n=1 Tax=Photinus pyralis TaxID=7054 RepID=A0A1Y1LQ18_PHOPY|nr:U3 small nucleolar RNA-associated protein 18 homolog [Photinus pyralis]KAB0792569.1 hypothetical protein PPYR_14528 [Photinus pyralis]
MPKQNRKRKHVSQQDDDQFEILAPKNKFQAFDKEAQAEEERLSNILFGGSGSFLKSLDEAEDECCVDMPAVTPDSGVGDDNESDGDSDRKPVWMDDDDGIDVREALNSQGRMLPKGGINNFSNQYSNLLKHKFETVIGTPHWASLKLHRRHGSESDEEEVLRTCGFIEKNAIQSMASHSLEFKKLKDLNSETYNEGIINCIEFHPSSTAALVAGSSGVASLFAVDGKRNNKLHSVAFERFPILCAQFARDGNEAILGSRHSHLYSYDLMAAKAHRVPLPHGLTQCKKFVLSPDSKYMAVAGKWGEVHLLSSKSKERLCLLKQDADVTALCFNPTGNLLYGHSATGEVTIWDMNMRRVKYKWTDEGCLEGSTLSISPTNQFIATGSTHGIVNIYGTEDILRSNTPKPRKTLFNLTTGVTSMTFNSTSEFVAFAATDIENSTRLFHIGTGTVFSNFPPFGTKLGNITAMNVSPGSGYIAFGNKKSTVALYRLKHFKVY